MIPPPFFILLMCTKSIFTKFYHHLPALPTNFRTTFTTFYYLLLIFTNLSSNFATFYTTFTNFLPNLICYTTSLAKTITPNQYWQQAIPYKFSHFHLKMDVYCQVINNKNLYDLLSFN